MKNFRRMIGTILFIVTMISLCGSFSIASNHQKAGNIQYIVHSEEINAPGTGTSYNVVDEYDYVTASSLKVNSGASQYVQTSTTLSSSYKKVDQYVYVSSNSLNVRTGPGTSYKKVGVLSKGVKVHRTAIGDNGWSKIEYEGKTRYVSSKYLTSKKTSSSSKSSVGAKKKSRSIGRLKIKSVGIDVALYEVSCYDSKKNQAVVDRKDSAAYMPDANDYFGFTIIGDHSNQGFVKMKKAIPGKTTAVIDFGTYKETYICTKKFKGRNVGEIVDLNGDSIAGRNNGGLTMYTCNSDGTITITFWEKK